ncbi:hypothetical protein OEV98_15250 [Caldibacillus lycopersici]|uniref:Integral inner membrane protein n=1 Tax=Perspicuibacillus lycopersici TaxID=1325689 RepID=A0AAE3IUJ8_9BACI|nr:hypothetical protein [Perspicuibacillus lycopersici]MCU9614900.1 hypothetical protein [Perspicuibacillus lycopersici]
MNIVGWMIVLCEIAFWIVIILGLVVRYILKKKQLGLIFLALTPLIDVILLITAGIDLYRGEEATVAHAVAAVYIGVSVAFGKSMIEWADQRFQYYVTKQGEKPRKRYGFEFSKHYFKGWIRHLIAYIIGVGLLIGLIFWIDNTSKTEALSAVAKMWSFVIGIDLLISISYFIWPPRERGVSSRN